MQIQNWLRKWWSAQVLRMYALRKWIKQVWRDDGRILLQAIIFLIPVVLIGVWAGTSYNLWHAPAWMVASGTYILLGKILAGLAALALIVWIIIRTVRKTHQSGKKVSFGFLRPLLSWALVLGGLFAAVYFTKKFQDGQDRDRVERRQAYVRDSIKARRDLASAMKTAIALPVPDSSADSVAYPVIVGDNWSRIFIRHEGCHLGIVTARGSENAILDVETPEETLTMVPGRAIQAQHPMPYFRLKSETGPALVLLVVTKGDPNLCREVGPKPPALPPTQNRPPIIATDG